MNSLIQRAGNKKKGKLLKRTKFQISFMFSFSARERYRHEQIYNFQLPAAVNSPKAGNVQIPPRNSTNGGKNHSRETLSQQDICYIPDSVVSLGACEGKKTGERQSQEVLDIIIIKLEKPLKKIKFLISGSWGSETRNKN